MNTKDIEKLIQIEIVNKQFQERQRNSLEHRIKLLGGIVKHLTKKLNKAQLALAEIINCIDEIDQDIELCREILK